MPFSDRELFARLIQCEAGGEGDIGMAAVASVVMNRVHYPVGEYARVGRGNLRDIILQAGQFECARTSTNGQYNPQNIYNMNPTGIHYAIADWAIAGNRLPGLGDALWFYNPFNSNCRQTFPSDVGYYIGSYQAHCFYDPTDLYEFT